MIEQALQTDEIIMPHNRPELLPTDTLDDVEFKRVQSGKHLAHLSVQLCAIQSEYLEAIELNIAINDRLRGLKGEGV